MRRIEGPTPAGGAYVESFCFDDQGNEVDESKSTNIRIHEYDSTGKLIKTTYGLMSSNVNQAIKIENIKYYKLENGGIARLTNNVTLDSLDLNGNWVPNQYAISMFADGMLDYEEISSEEVTKIVNARANGEMSRGMK